MSFITSQKLEIAHVSINRKTDLKKKLWHIPTFNTPSPTVIKRNALLIHNIGEFQKYAE